MTGLKLRISDPGARESHKRVEYDVIGGYFRKDGKSFVLAVDRNELVVFRALYHLVEKNETAQWYGSLEHKAQERFDETPEGGTFRYRNRPYRRMTHDELVKEVAKASSGWFQFDRDHVPYDA